jgi:hypothetical protein
MLWLNIPQPTQATETSSRGYPLFYRELQPDFRAFPQQHIYSCNIWGM